MAGLGDGMSGFEVQNEVEHFQYMSYGEQLIPRGGCKDLDCTIT